MLPLKSIHLKKVVIMLKQYKVRDYDFKLIILVVALTVIGIFTVGSADESLQKTQISGFVFGLFLMVVISLFDYSVLIKLYWFFYIANIALLFWCGLHWASR